MAVASAPGTGTISLGATVNALQTFAAAGAVSGQPYSYRIDDSSNFEIGVGIYTAGSPPTLTRTPLYSSTGALLNASSPAVVSAVILAGDVGTPGTPQGRLNLTQGVSVLTSTVSAATSVLYTPYAGTLIPPWNGLADVMVTFAEMSQALSDTSKSPSAAQAGQVYDLFVWGSPGNISFGRGPAWTAGATAGSNTARGSGAGSTALTRVNGLLRNAVAITNGPAAGYGTYVGTIATDASGATVTFNRGSAAAGGGTATIGLWNAFNRRPVRGQVRDTNSLWSIGTTPAYADAGSTTFRVAFVVGLAEDPWTARYNALLNASATQFCAAWVGLDGTAVGGTTSYTAAISPSATSVAERTETPFGQHFFAPVEYSNGGTATGYGTSGTAQIQTGLNWEGRY